MPPRTEPVRKKTNLGDKSRAGFKPDIYVDATRCYSYRGNDRDIASATRKIAKGSVTSLDMVTFFLRMFLIRGISGNCAIRMILIEGINYKTDNIDTCALCT